MSHEPRRFSLQGAETSAAAEEMYVDSPAMFSADVFNLPPAHGELLGVPAAGSTGKDEHSGGGAPSIMVPGAKLLNPATYRVLNGSAPQQEQAQASGDWSSYMLAYSNPGIQFAGEATKDSCSGPSGMHHSLQQLLQHQHHSPATASEYSAITGMVINSSSSEPPQKNFVDIPLQFSATIPNMEHCSSHAPWQNRVNELLLLPSAAEGNQFSSGGMWGSGGSDSRSASVQQHNYGAIDGKVQSLSLSLSSSNSNIHIQQQQPQQHHHHHPISPVMESRNKDAFKSSNANGGYSCFTVYNNGRSDAFLAPAQPSMAAYAAFVKNSRYMKPAQLLLDEFCCVAGTSFGKNPKQQQQKLESEISFGGGGTCASGSAPNSGGGFQDHPKAVAATVGSSSVPCTTNTITVAAATSTSTASAGNRNEGGIAAATRDQLLLTGDRFELQRKKTKLLWMLDEVDRRYRQYCEQMRGVVTSFEAVAGQGSATTYTALAYKAMSRHFRCLKDAISGQVKIMSEQLGEHDSGLPGTTKGETPRLKVIEQSLRQPRAFHQQVGGMLDHEAWRPQRGLPERSVSVLRSWLFEHFLHPYPSDADKHLLARQAGLTRSQVSNWFINARVRLWKPMVEEMYQEELKEAAQRHRDRSDARSSLSDNPDDEEEDDDDDNMDKDTSRSEHEKSDTTNNNNNVVVVNLAQHNRSGFVHNAAMPDSEAELKEESCSGAGISSSHDHDNMIFEAMNAHEQQQQQLQGQHRLSSLTSIAHMYQQQQQQQQQHHHSSGDVSLTLGLRHSGPKYSTNSLYFPG